MTLSLQDRHRCASKLKELKKSAAELKSAELKKTAEELKNSADAHAHEFKLLKTPGLFSSQL